MVIKGVPHLQVKPTCMDDINANGHEWASSPHAYFYWQPAIEELSLSFFLVTLYGNPKIK